jgi:hypothetical protein
MSALYLFTAVIVLAWFYTLWSLRQAFRRQRARDLAAGRDPTPSALEDEVYRAAWQCGKPAATAAPVTQTRPLTAAVSDSAAKNR